MKLLGLTGSIGMGKTTTAGLFREAGVPVWDADAAVHVLYGPGGAATALIAAGWPGTTGPAGVDRAELARRVGNDSGELKRLEATVHPLLAGERATFIERARAGAADVIVFDVPLLFETGGHLVMDAVVVVSAPPDVQRERVLARAGMTPELFERLLARQTPDADKRRLADFVVDTSRGIEAARTDVAAILTSVRAPGFTPRRNRLDDAVGAPH